MSLKRTRPTGRTRRDSGIPEKTDAEVILVDTSVWVDHLRKGDKTLVELLLANQVLGHPFIVGEIALGHLPDRRRILSSLRQLPQDFFL